MMQTPENSAEVFTEEMIRKARTSLPPIPIWLGPGWPRSGEAYSGERTVVLSHDKAIRGLIDQLIHRAGLTQSEVARRLGLNRSTIQKYRDGRIKNPSLAWVVRLAEVCEAKVLVEFPR